MSLILDDIMDGSDKRRGKECWYKKEDVGIIAVNDAMLIKNGVYYMLKKKFGDKSYYIAMVNLVHEITFITTLGQCMDLNPSKLPVTEFTLERFNNIADYKTAYFGVYLPVALAMIMVGYEIDFIIVQFKLIKNKF